MNLYVMLFLKLAHKQQKWEQANRFSGFSFVYKSSLIRSCMIVSEEFTNQNNIKRILAYALFQKE